MKILKSGKEEIVYLLTKVIEKYKQETGQELVLNTNRKNYEVLAILLSEISNQLPIKWEVWGAEQYLEDTNKKNQDYPYRKYDITGGQIKDALNGIVSNPRSFLIDACYIYLFSIGRKKFEKHPLDYNLLLNHTNNQNKENETSTISLAYENQIKEINTQNKSKIFVYKTVALLLTAVVVTLSYYSYTTKVEYKTIMAEMNILPYKPTKAEIDSLEGIWLCYTGSPQARISDPLRYHKVVPNLIEVTHKNGYFTFNRFGASFNHIGYMQFESPGIISVYSRIKNTNAVTESPRHSLLSLYTSKQYLTAISASWNFDVGDKNKIIGIREVFIKLGKGGIVKEVINEVENASCNCKVINWEKPDKTIKKVYLKNELLDSLHLNFLKSLIDEKSIIENIPQDKLLISKDSLVNYTIK